MWAELVDLVLPATCAGCGAPGSALCRACAAAFASATPAAVRLDAPPSGLPRCVALAAYAGALRGAILAYKERGGYPLAGPLGDRLAEVVAAAVGDPPAAGVLLLPVPATARAARRRYGDHMVRLARRAAGRLRSAGWTAGVAYPLRALPRPDSSGLSRAERVDLAAGRYAPVPRRLDTVREAVATGARPVLVDDVVTTGATLAAAARCLRGAGLHVPAAAVLAATPRRNGREMISNGTALNLSPNEG